jgi:hypothetical protein
MSWDVPEVDSTVCGLSYINALRHQTALRYDPKSGHNLKFNRSITSRNVV